MGEYLYCIMAGKKTPKRFKAKGLEEEKVRTLRYRDMAAVVSKTPVKEYDPSEENVEKHKAVELGLLKKHTVLPVAFGMVFKSKGILTNTMRKVYPVLKKTSRLIDNKIELGVKCIFPKDMEELDLKDKSRDEFQAECEKEFVEALNKIAVESKRGELFSERLVFNRSFLVDRDRIKKFSKALGKLDDKHPALRVNYSGPWPPYNFVDIRIMSRGRTR